MLICYKTNIILLVPKVNYAVLLTQSLGAHCTHTSIKIPIMLSFLLKHFSLLTESMYTKLLLLINSTELKKF